jgi:2-polyprenyl-3-methyl-5-hydroxy-6-metoxy-1,4-benzoquinol methylase
MALDLQLDRPVSSSIPKVDVPACPSCGSTDRDFKFEAIEHEYANTTDDTFIFKACKNCGAAYLDPQPDVTALSTIYPPNYYANVLESQAIAGADNMKAMSGFYKTISLAILRLRLRPLTRHMQLGPKTTWLDIGCGHGWVLETINEVYGTKGIGLDMSETAVEHCRRRGIEAYAGRFEDFERDDALKFDFIHSSHVIEHVSSPYEYMRKCWDLLKPGGLCVFVTPNIGTPEAKWFGAHWGGLHVPRHWTLLDDRSARILGERSGFEHVGTSFSTNGTFWNWSFHSLLQNKISAKWNDRIFPSDHRLVKSSLYNLLLLSGFAVLDMLNVIITRQSGNMFCIFRKPASS